MTGAETKQQVTGWLDVECDPDVYDAFAACTVLTPQEREKRDEMVNRVFYIAEHLHSMIPREVWRANGAELEGHYEGDFHAEKIRDELGELYRVLLSPDPEIFAPRDPHTYVTHEPESSGAGGSLPPVESGALLGADPAPDDIGPPAPGEGDDLPNPEAGMEC